MAASATITTPSQMRDRRACRTGPLAATVSFFLVVFGAAPGPTRDPFDPASRLTSAGPAGGCPTGSP
ncbi:hypothetical protein GCM10022230_02710 [Pseudoclavibacter caeni]